MTRTRTTTISLIAAFLLLAGFGSPLVGAATERTVPVRDGDLVEIGLDTGGSVLIRGGSGGEARIEVRTHGPDADEARIDIEETSRGVRVTSLPVHRRKSSRFGVDVEVAAPPGVTVDVRTLGGSVTVDGFRGEVSGKTMGGSLTFRDADVRSALTTMGGSIEVTRSRIDGSLKTMGGSIRLDDLTGDVDLTTMGGDVTVVSAPEGGEVSTMGGSITVFAAGDDLAAKTMGGNLRLEGIAGGLEASTMGGDADVVLVPGRTDRSVSVTSQSGDVRIVVPEGLGVSLDVELLYTKTSARDFEIESDIPLDLDESDWEYGYGSPRRRLVGRAVVGDGGTEIRLRTTNGDIVIETSGR